MLLSSSLLALLSDGSVAGNWLDFALVCLIIFVLWLLFENEGLPGWLVLIPIVTPVFFLFVESVLPSLFTLLTGGSVTVILLGAALIILLTIALWRIFKKAGLPGWIALIPILNIAAYLGVAKLPPWMFLFYFGVLIPPYGISAVLLFNLLVTALVGAAFNKSAWFIVGLVLLPVIFLPILAFGDSKYDFYPYRA